MNDFTKEELITLKNGIEYLPNNVNLSKQYMFNCGVILGKLQEMIDNYCDHEFTLNASNFPPKLECVKCNIYYD